MPVILVHRRTDELGRRRGFFDVDDKLAAKLIKRGDAKLARRARTGGAVPLKAAASPPGGENGESDELPLEGEALEVELVPALASVPEAAPIDEPPAAPPRKRGRPKG